MCLNCLSIVLNFLPSAHEFHLLKGAKFTVEPVWRSSITMENDLDWDGSWSLIYKEFFEIGVRIVTTASAVATVLLPLDIIKTRLQVGVVAVPQFGPALFNRALIQNWVNVNKASLTKNTVISNRDAVSTRVETMIDDQGNKPNFFKRHQGLLATTSIISILDTSFTQYYSNMSTLNSLGQEIPVLTRKQKLYFTKEGIVVRGGRNFITTLGLLSVNTVLSDFIHPWVSKEQVLAHTVLTTIVAGFCVAPASNALDVIYRRKIAGVNLETLRTPPYRQLIRNVVGQEGFNPFFRGSLLSGIYTSAAFGTISGISYILDNYVFPQTKEVLPVQESKQVKIHSLKDKPAFFTPVSVDNPKKTDTLMKIKKTAQSIFFSSGTGKRGVEGKKAEVEVVSESAKIPEPVSPF